MRIAGFAKGLLSLLDSQNFGNSPKDLVDAVQPTVELSELYLLTKYQGVFGGTVGNLAAGFNSTPDAAGVNLVVPSCEVWRLYACSVSVIPAAASTGTFSPSLLLNNTAVQLTDSADYVASTRKWVSGPKIGPIWMPAGSELGVIAQNVVGTTPASLQALVAKLRS